MKKNRGLFLVPVCCFMSIVTYSQSFNFEADIQNVSKSGFYQIMVSPEISSYTNPDLSDLRIKSPDGREVARILNTSTVASQLKLNEFPFTILNADTAASRYICKAPPGLLISNLSFYLSSANALRYASVSGSNDSLRWFSVADHFLLDVSAAGKLENSVITIAIPASRYQFYKLRIDNDHHDPIRVLKIGTLQADSAAKLREAAFTKNPNPVLIMQTDSSNKRSYIRIQFANPYHVDGFLVRIAGTTFFERQSQLYQADSLLNANIPRQLISSFTLTSSKPGYLTIPRTACSVFMLVIENDDNPPLKVESCTSRQIATSMIAWFDSGKKFTISMGNAKLPPPNYDLEKFTDSIPKILQTLSVGTIHPFKRQLISSGTSAKNQWWIWPLIVLALVTLGTLSWKLLQDIKNEKK